MALVVMDTDSVVILLYIIDKVMVDMDSAVMGMDLATDLDMDLVVMGTDLAVMVTGSAVIPLYIIVKVTATDMVMDMDLVVMDLVAFMDKQLVQKMRRQKVE